jgi:hypothetical protein
MGKDSLAEPSSQFAFAHTTSPSPNLRSTKGKTQGAASHGRAFPDATVSMARRQFAG